MNCRICNYKCKKIYTSDKLPECIWPTKKKNNFSKIKVYSCLKCHHLQLQNFSKKRILNFYGDTQYVLDKSFENKNRIQLIKKKYGNNFFINKKILDVGGGTNPILKNKNTFILDFKIQKKIKKIFKERSYKLDIEEKNIKKKFDVIFLIHTLEHFKYPGVAIKNLRSLLKKDGIMFIEIPNFNHQIRKNTYYSIFHQHLSLFTLAHLKNFLNLCLMKTENIFINKNVIFCSVRKTDKKNNILFINNKNIINIFKKNFEIMKKKVFDHLKNNNFNIYGAGGSMVLLVSSLKKLKKNINMIYDNQNSKQLKIFPGTNIRISKYNKVKNRNNFFSLSSYDLTKKNNLNIKTI